MRHPEYLGRFISRASPSCKSMTCMDNPTWLTASMRLNTRTTLSLSARLIRTPPNAGQIRICFGGNQGSHGGAPGLLSLQGMRNIFKTRSLMNYPRSTNAIFTRPITRASIIGARNGNYNPFTGKRGITDPVRTYRRRK